MRCVTRMLFYLTAVMIVFEPCLFAEVPHLINYQGRLTDGSGNPIDGSYTIVFKIYNDPTGGMILWTETHTGVAVTDGLFDVVLGSVVTMSSDVFSSQPLWLGLTLDGNPELSPRTQIVAVAYAYRAEHADTSSYAHAGGGWVDDGTVVRLAMGTDSVGIGTGAPAEKLHVNGDIRLNSSSSVAFGSDNSRLYSSSTDMFLTADDDIYLQPDDDIYVRRDGGSAWVHFDNSIGRLGIGTTNPAYRLTVDGSISIAVDGASKYHINYYQGGLNFAETGVQDRRIHIGDGGDVGIGTASPGAKLGVNGDLRVNGAFKGDIASSSTTDGAPFPRPAYDSGWLAISQCQTHVLNHNIGGDSTNYVIDMQLKGPGIGISCANFGSESDSYGQLAGVFYKELTSSQIEVLRECFNETTTHVRIRMWVIE